MFNRLKEIIKKVDGNVLTIGLEDELLENFKNNNKINLYSIYSEKENTKFYKEKKQKIKQGKSINIKKLRKYVNKKTVNYLIVNIEEVYKYYKYIIKDTIYLNNNKIYVYFTNSIDKNFIVNKYERYNVKIKVTEYKNGYIVEIDNREGKNNWFKDKMYLISDTFYNIAEFIGNILVS